MKEREVSPTELADEVGITLANLLILKTRKAKAVRCTTLDAICRALECQPGDALSDAVMSNHLHVILDWIMNGHGRSGRA